MVRNGNWMTVANFTRSASGAAAGSRSCPHTSPQRTKGKTVTKTEERELSEFIARKIFEAGDHNGKCLRIQYKIGLNPERDGAGWGEQPLARFIEKTLKERASAAPLIASSNA